MMGGCYVGKGAGARRSVGRPGFLSPAPRCSIDSLGYLLCECIGFDHRGLRLIVTVVAERLGMLCGNTYTPRRPLEAG